MLLRIARPRTFPVLPYCAVRKIGLNGYVRASITKELWASLHAFDLLETVALSLKGHIEDDLGRPAAWAEIKQKTNVHQQYLLAFVESDGVLDSEVYFARGMGEMYQEFIGGVTAIGDVDMRKLIIKSVKTIEHPNHWTMFKSLLHKTELNETEEAQFEHLKGLFASYDKEYVERRERTAKIFEEFVRKNQEDFLNVE